MQLIRSLIQSPLKRITLKLDNQIGLPDESSLKYLIFAHGRSGSSTLVKIANLHPKIMLCHEPFNRRKLDLRALKYKNITNRIEKTIATIDDIEEGFNIINQKYNGFKHVIGQLKQDIEPHILTGRNYKVIFLQRRNLLQMVISSLIARKMQKWGGGAERWRKKFKQHQFKPFDIELIQKRIQGISEKIKKYKQLLKDNNIDFYNVYYEDLYGPDVSEEKKLQIINEIFEFWGVGKLKKLKYIKQAKELLDPGKYKLNSEETYKQIPNYKEIEEQCGSDETGWLFNGLDTQQPTKPIFNSSKNTYTDTSLIKPIKKYAFVFVCQEGPLEIEALFLAASLKRFLKCDYELIAAIPRPESIFGKPSEITLNLLKEMGVEIGYIYNDIVAKNPNIDFKKHRVWLMTNKLFAIKLANKLATSADKIIFLDSDMLLHKKFTGDICFSIPFNARLVPMGATMWFDGKWDQFFQLAGATMPPLRIKRTKNNDNQPSCNYIPPSFNAGFIGLHNNLVNEFSAEWIKCFNKIISQDLIDNTYFLEEITWGITMHKMQMPYNILNIDYPNLPFFHYAPKSKLKNNNKMINLMQSILKEYPSIKKIINNNHNWQFLLY
ncbi:hypothetical protein KJ742_05725 [Patescibacteria group bacterium]|nr:hypothetical protein [Patescibacteria group bacterium]